MRAIKVAFDLDRVIFDTNAYFRSLDSRLRGIGRSFEEVFEGVSGRKSIDYLFDVLMRDFNEAEVRRILFSGVDEHMSKELKSIAASVIANGGDVFIVSVGNRHQLEKLVGFPHSRVFIVKGDDDKVKKVAALGVDIFVDDKAAVVKKLRSMGVRAFQALWFLDEEHRRGALVDALKKPSELEELVVGMLHEH